LLIVGTETSTLSWLTVNAYMHAQEVDLRLFSLQNSSCQEKSAIVAPNCFIIIFGWLQPNFVYHDACLVYLFIPAKIIIRSRLKRRNNAAHIQPNKQTSQEGVSQLGTSKENKEQEARSKV